MRFWACSAPDRVRWAHPLTRCWLATGQRGRTYDAGLVAKLRGGELWDVQDARQLLNLQKIVDACYESARTGREIVL